MDYNVYTVYLTTDTSSATAASMQREILRIKNVFPVINMRLVCFASLNPTRAIMLFEDTSPGLDGSAWTHRQNIESHLTDVFQTPAMLLDSDRATIHYVYRARIGGSWGMRYARTLLIAGAVGHVTLPFTAQISWPSACIGNDDWIYAVCMQTVGFSDVYLSRRNPATGVWTAQQIIAKRNPPATPVLIPSIVAFERNGNQCVECIFVEFNTGTGDFELTNNWSTDGGVTWRPSVLTSRVDDDNGQSCSYNSIAYDPVRERVYAVYIKRDVSNSIYQVWLQHKTPSQGVWSSPVQVNAALAQTGCLDPSVTINKDGRIYVAWSQKNKGTQKGGAQEMIEVP